MPTGDLESNYKSPGKVRRFFEGIKTGLSFKPTRLDGWGGGGGDFSGGSGGGGDDSGGPGIGQSIMPVLRSLLLGGQGGSGLATSIGAAGKSFSVKRSLLGMAAQVAFVRTSKGHNIYESVMEDKARFGSIFAAQTDGMGVDQYNQEVLDNMDKTRYKKISKTGLSPKQYFSQLVMSAQYLDGITHSGLPEGFAQLDKALGLSKGQSMESALGLRQSIGMDAARAAPGKIVEEGVSQGLRKQLVPYMKSMVSLLNNISASGGGAVGPLATVVGDIAADAGISPEAAANVTASVHAGISGAQGDQASAIQLAYMQAGLAKNPLEAQFLMRDKVCKQCLLNALND